MYKAQTAARKTANKKLKAERHAKRMAEQSCKVLKKPRGLKRFMRHMAEEATAE